MAATTTLPTAEDIKKWQERWSGTNAKEMFAVIKNTKWTETNVNALEWYKESQFERFASPDWLKRIHPDKITLDLRGFPFASENNGEELALILPTSHLEGAQLKNMNLKDTNLYDAHLEGADLSETYHENTNLRKAQLENANLKHAHLVNANLSGANLKNCQLKGIDLRSNKGHASFDSDTSLGTLWIFDKNLSIKDLDDCKSRVNTCSEIRLCFKDNGLFHQAATYYEQEEHWRTRQKRLEGKQWSYLLRLVLAEKPMGYGERPANIIISSAFIIWVFSVAYYLFGIAIEKKDGAFHEPFVGLKQCLFSLKSVGYYFKSLQFSIENFTTLGFSVIKPTEGMSHWFATFEGLAGALMIALATVVYVRKAVRD